MSSPCLPGMVVKLRNGRSTTIVHGTTDKPYTIAGVSLRRVPISNLFPGSGIR